MMNAAIFEQLKSAGVVQGELVDVDRYVGEAGDLMPWLESVWRPSHGDGRAWIDHNRTNKLCLVDETCGHRAMFDLLSSRLLWMPKSIALGCGEGKQCLGIVSSRLGRELDSKSAWFRSLRAACVQGAKRGETLLTSAGSTTDRFTQRCQELFGIEICRIVVSTTDDLSDWFRRCVVEQDIDADPGGQSTIFVSPDLQLADKNADRKGTCHRNYADIPVADSLLAALSHRLIGLSVRQSGNWDRLIRWRLKSPDVEPGRTLLALGEQLVPARLRDELLSLGAVGWAVWPHDSRSNRSRAGGVKTARSCDEMSRRQQIDPIEAAEFDDSESTVHSPIASDTLPIPAGEYLTHCTRRRNGPWPDQDENTYLDTLILQHESANHSALAALRRIIEMRRLVASAESVRGDVPMVSFTEVPLEELRQLRVFRPHRGRWDFEPYGVCIRRDWIRQHAGRRVCYAPRAKWDALSDDERLYYQLDISVTKSGNEIDWTVEQEWRVRGDLRLELLSSTDAFVFVSVPDEIPHLSGVCPWPIVALSESSAISSFEVK